MKKAVLVSGIQIFPPRSGGQWRTASLARALADNGFEVQIFSFTGRKEGYVTKARSWKYQRGPHISEYVCRGKIRALLQWLCYRLNLPDLWHLIPLPTPKILKTSLREAELAIADFPFLSKYLGFSSGKKVIHSHNLEFQRWRGILSNRVKQLEILSISYSDEIWVTNQQEKDFYLSHGANQVRLVPNSASVERFSNPSFFRKKTRHELSLKDFTSVILFTGSHYLPNQRAFAFLKSFSETHQDWLLEKKLCFLVVGSVCSEKFLSKTLIATGPVESIEPYFAASDLAINPVEEGSGTNLKMAEYLCAQLPLLSTSFGTRGFALEEKSHFVRFDKNSLKQALENILALPTKALADMAHDAFLQNRSILDLRLIIQSHFN